MKKSIPNTIMIQAVERPARKLILLRSVKGTDYFSYCEEKGCDWEGLLNSVPEKMDQAALIELPESLRTNGTSTVAAGIEVPLDYCKPIPGSYEVIELPPCTMLYFQGMPFENDEDFDKALSIAFEALENYRPEEFGYEFADDIAPRFNFGASAQSGAKLAVPVRVPAQKQ